MITRNWLFQQIIDKLIFGLIASLVGGLALFQFDQINDRISNLQKSNEIHIGYLSGEFAKFSDNILQTITLLTKERDGFLETTKGKPDLRDPILNNGIEISVYASTFNNSSDIKNKINICIGIFNDSLNYSVTNNLTKKKINNAISSLSLCHKNASKEMISHLKSVAKKNYDDDSKDAIQWAWIVLLLMLGIGVIVLSLVYYNSPKNQ